MMGHLSVPAIDPTPAPVRAFAENVYGTRPDEVPHDATLPATVSRTLVDILRRDLAFDGLVVTDAFDMGGLVAHFDAGEAAVRAIEAGEDQIMFSPDTDAAIAAVREAVRSGRVSAARIDESVERIMSAKKRIRGRAASQDEIFRTLDSAEHRAMAEEIARRAVTLVRDERGLLPLHEGNVTAVVVSDIPEVENPLADAVRDLGAKNTFALDVRSTEDDIAAIDGDVVVLLLALRAKSGAGRIAVPRAARLLAERHARKTIAVSFGSPYLIRELPGVGTYVCAYGIQPVMQRAAVRVLRGAEAPGRLPSQSSE
jgi:beta-N-acetylhexosaminidase